MSDSNDPVEQFLKLLENPRVQAVLNKIIETKVNECLITSELKPVKRIAELEKLTGIYNFEDFEEHVLTIPEQINLLSERMDRIESNPQASKPSEPISIIPETKTEVRAVFIKEYLDNKTKKNDGELFLNNNEIRDLITHIIPKEKPECEVKKGQNIRKIKKDAIDKLVKLFPFNISINKSKHGRHETRVMYRSLQTVTS